MTINIGNIFVSLCFFRFMGLADVPDTEIGCSRVMHQVEGFPIIEATSTIYEFEAPNLNILNIRMGIKFTTPSFMKDVEVGSEKFSFLDMISLPMTFCEIWVENTGGAGSPSRKVELYYDNTGQTATSTDSAMVTWNEGELLSDDVNGGEQQQQQQLLQQNENGGEQHTTTTGSQQQLLLLNGTSSYNNIKRNNSLLRYISVESWDHPWFPTNPGDADRINWGKWYVVFDNSGSEDEEEEGEEEEGEEEEINSDPTNNNSDNNSNGDNNNSNSSSSSSTIGKTKTTTTKTTKSFAGCTATSCRKLFATGEPVEAEKRRDGGGNFPEMLSKPSPVQDLWPVFSVQFDLGELGQNEKATRYLTFGYDNNDAGGTALRYYGTKFPPYWARNDNHTKTGEKSTTATTPTTATTATTPTTTQIQQQPKAKAKGLDEESVNKSFGSISSSDSEDTNILFRKLMAKYIGKREQIFAASAQFDQEIRDDLAKAAVTAVAVEGVGSTTATATTREKKISAAQQANATTAILTASATTISAIVSLF